MATGQLRRIATVESEIEKNPDMKIEYLEIFKDWVHKQPHFPQADDDIVLLQFLRRCRYNIEKAKVKLDNFLTFRTQFPEMCKNRTVDQPDMKRLLTDWQHVILPKRDAKGNVVMIVRPINPDATFYNPCTTVKILTTLMECYVRENGTIPGYVVIFDSTNTNMGHLTKCTFKNCRQFLFFVQKCSCVSVKGLYNVNSHSLAETALKIIKSFSYGKMISKIEMFPQGAIESLYEHIPKEILPKEYGGEAGTMDELHREAYEAIQRVSSYTIESDKHEVNEQKRIGAKINFGTLFGVEGSFKKLDVD